MDFLSWHYSSGLKLYLSRWLFVVRWVSHFFSLPQLLLSLFSPYKRLIDNENKPGFNLELWFRQLTFNLISRCIGAIVRVWLFIFGCLLLIAFFVIGLIGLLFWIFLPPIGLVYFATHDPQGQRRLNKLIDQINAHPQIALQTLFQSLPGQFLISKLGVDESKLIPPVYLDISIRKQEVVSLTQIVHKFIEAGYWEQRRLVSAGLTPDDLLLCAHWWDKNQGVEQVDNDELRLGRPGIGLSLIFGYTPTLDKYGTDMSITQEFASHLIARTDIVSRMERSFSSGRGVLLSGLPGVGKKTIVYEFAHKCRTGQLGRDLSYKRIIEFDYNIILSGSIDIAQKKTLLSQILTEAVNAGNIILVIKDLHRLTNVETEGLDFTDTFEQFLEAGRLQLIVIESSVDYDRFLSSNSRIRKHLEVIEASPPTIDQATEILLEFSNVVAVKERITIQIPAIRAAISGSDKYVTDTPFPEKALELMDHAIALAKKMGSSVITKDMVNQVLSERTGISLARLTESEKAKLNQIEELIHKRVVGQEQAASLIGKTLRARAAGTKSENRPLGSLLFLGPTGVGKTETAKALAEVYFGSESSVLRFDMAEYAGPEGLIRLIGSVSKNLPGAMTTAIKKHPANLLLLDEIEKAPPEVFNLFLSLLDEGVITDAFGQKIICKNLFVIATSNAGAAYIRDLVNQQDADLTSQVIDYVQKQRLFSPEFLNRFDGVVVFEPLKSHQLRQIASNMLSNTAKNLMLQGIKLTASNAAIDKLVQLGYKPEFGARPMRRLIEIEVGDTIGSAILSGKIVSGDNIELIPAEPGPFSYRKP